MYPSVTALTTTAALSSTLDLCLPFQISFPSCGYVIMFYTKGSPVVGPGETDGEEILGSI